MTTIKQHYTSVKNGINSVFVYVIDKLTNNGFAHKLKHLTPSQWCYFAALFLLFTGFENGDVPEGRLGLVAFVAGVGFARELFRVFPKIWDSMLGKGVFLLLYAAVANIALALAAVKVNSIAGIEPAILTFSVAFTLTLTLPIWFFIATILFGTVLMAIGTVWLLFTLLLRLVRIKIKVHGEDSVFVIVSMIARMVLLVIVMVTMSDMIDPYMEQFSDKERGVSLFSITPPRIDALEAKEATAAEESTDANSEPETLLTVDVNGPASEDAGSEDALPAGPSSNAIGDESEDTTKDENANEEEDNRIIDKLIATFIYNFETYRSSACKQADNERVVAIDENSIFVAKRADNELGFEFYVMPCIHRYSDESYPP